MQDIKTNQETNGQTPTEEEKQTASFGKFADAQSLYQAYQSLEAEFTRRSQRLKELELRQATPPSTEDVGAKPLDESDLIEKALASSKVRDAILSAYVKERASGKCVPLMTNGVNLSAPRRTPSSIEEAGKMVQQFLHS